MSSNMLNKVANSKPAKRAWYYTRIKTTVLNLLQDGRTAEYLSQYYGVPAATINRWHTEFERDALKQHHEVNRMINEHYG